jgi:hypothetical protein
MPRVRRRQRALPLYESHDPPLHHSEGPQWLDSEGPQAFSGAALTKEKESSAGAARQLLDADIPRQIAGRLLKDFYHSLSANKTDFNRVLVYPNPGLSNDA